MKSKDGVEFANKPNNQHVDQQHSESEGVSSPNTGDDDFFNPEKLKLSQDFAAELGVKKALISVPVRRPDKQAFIRVHPDAGFRLDTAVIELKEEGETYLVHPSLRPELLGEVVPKTLFTTITRQGVVSLWPVRLPGPDGRHDEWNRSALEAATMAMKTWIRVSANRSLGAYEVFVATGNLPEPEWPDASFQELLKIAFKDRFIQSTDHPVMKRLRGDA
jgi:hypothetical protein